ncbi:MAG: hypothetical protein ACI9MN_001583, partial [Saprospiraceae bacterium]
MTNYPPTELAKAKAIHLTQPKLISRLLKAALLTSIVVLAWALSSTVVWAN